MGQKCVAKLDNWSVQRITGSLVIIWGDVENDLLDRFGDGERIHTSAVKSREFKEGDVVKTLNNSYLLGVEYSG